MDGNRTPCLRTANQMLCHWDTTNTISLGGMIIMNIFAFTSAKQPRLRGPGPCERSLTGVSTWLHGAYTAHGAYTLCRCVGCFTRGYSKWLCHAGFRLWYVFFLVRLKKRQLWINYVMKKRLVIHVMILHCRKKARLASSVKYWTTENWFKFI